MSEAVGPSYPPGTLKSLVIRSSRSRNLGSQSPPKTARRRKRLIKLTHMGLALQKLDSFAHHLTKKAAKSELVAPTYPLGTLKIMGLKSIRVIQFLE